MNAKRFFYVAAGILLLVIAYSVGAHRAGAQAGGQFAGIAVDGAAVTTTAITSNGDVYARGGMPYCRNPTGPPHSLSWWGGDCVGGGWTYMGNVLEGTVQVQGKSMSDVKGTYRGK